MKHAFAIIDKLMIVLKFVPAELGVDPRVDFGKGTIALVEADKKRKAAKTLCLLEEYAHILKKLLTCHKTKKYLHRLHETKVVQVEKLAEEIARTFTKIDKLLEMLEEDFKKLAHALKNDPTQWGPLIRTMSLGMVMSGLHDGYGDMEKLKEIALLEVHELEDIIEHPEHARNLAQWHGLASLSEAEQMVKHEEFFLKLLG